MQDTVSGDRAARLFELLQRQDVPRQIHNIIGKMALLFEAALYDERLEFIAEKTSWVTIEIGSRGVFEGVDGARRCLVDIERTFEKSHTAGMRKAFPDVKFGTFLEICSSSRHTAKIGWEIAPSTSAGNNEGNSEPWWLPRQGDDQDV